jgi:UDP-N-acetylglucosamine--N-acetylmuramyl-(pentapeptide) pyrophosphoryl-undecaprenol N-acetylglucosamine transferase
MSKIIFTGGATGGHIIPNIPLIKKFQDYGFEIHYFGIPNDIEKKVLPKDIFYHKVTSGKLRRYFDIKNFSDPFLVILGTIRAIFQIRKIAPNVVFSKGGFVAIPIIIGSWVNGIPIILHESDIIPSLTTRLTYFFCKFICVGFPIDYNLWTEALNKKVIYTGIPLREEILKYTQKSSEEVLKNKTKPTLLIFGGSSGSLNINSVVRSVLSVLSEKFTIIHVCGLGNKIQSSNSSYVQYEFIESENITKFLEDADLVITRGGATFLYELIALKKTALVIPLSLSASRGDQLVNAKFFVDSGFGESILESKLDDRSLIDIISFIFNNIEKYKQKLKNYKLPDANKIIFDLLTSEVKK